MATPIETVESFLRALEQGERERAFELLADDVVYQNVPFPADRGKPAVMRTFQRFEKVMTKFEVKMKNIAANGDVVLTERIDILSGPLLHLDIWVCGTFEVKNGKIVLWRDYFDLAEVTAKLIASPFRKLLGLA
ncbi:MAG: limonene-1,2-epoxide hydrolase family protein [Polyangiales bacterium]